jgi:hypothetical protein
MYCVPPRSSSINLKSSSESAIRKFKMVYGPFILLDLSFGKSLAFSMPTSASLIRDLEPTIYCAE